MFECMSLLSHFSRVRLSATPWTTARQAPRSMGFSRQEHWSGLSVPSPVIKYEVSEVRSLSRVRLFTTLWTVAYQALPSMGFSRQEYWSGLPLPSPMDVLTRNKVTNKQSAAGQASAFHWDFNFCLSWKKLKVTQSQNMLLMPCRTIVSRWDTFWCVGLVYMNLMWLLGLRNTKE